MAERIALETLSRYFDGQLDPREQADLEARLTNDPEAQALLESFRTLSETLEPALLREALPANPRSDSECLDATVLLRLAEGVLTDAERVRVEQHIARCRRCLALTLAHLRTARRMQEQAWPSLPEDVLERREIRRLIRGEEPPPPPEERWGDLTIRLPVEQPQSVPFSSRDLAADVTIEPADGHQARLTLFVRERGRSLAGLEIHVRELGTRRKFLSGRTDIRGRFVITRLTPGQYEIHFSGSPLKIDVTVEDEPPVTR